MNSVFLDRLTPLPSGWKAGTIGEHCDVKTGGTPSTKIPSYYDPPEFFWVKSGDVKGGRIQNPPNQISAEGLAKSAAKLLPVGSVMIAMSGRGKTRGTTAVLNVKAACSQSVAAMIPVKDLASEFLHYQFVKRYDEIRNITGSDDRSGLNLALIRAIPIALPPFPEQKKIAHILSTVQRAIEAQDRIIQTTTELKKALMHKLFTEGLRNEPQKQTEIGPVPESWEVVDLGDVINLFAGYAFKSKEGVPASNTQLLRMGNLYQNSLDLSRKPIFYPDSFADDHQRFVLKEGDLVMSLTGTSGKEDYGFTVRIPKTEKALLLNQRVTRIEITDERLQKDFAHHFLLSRKFLDFLYPTAKGMKQANLSTNAMKKLKVVLPDEDEQSEIASCFKSLDRKVVGAGQKRDKLQDLFRTLLHELLTAKTRIQNIQLSTSDN